MPRARRSTKRPRYEPQLVAPYKRMRRPSYVLGTRWFDDVIPGYTPGTFTTLYAIKNSWLVVWKRLQSLRMTTPPVEIDWKLFNGF